MTKGPTLSEIFSQLKLRDKILLSLLVAGAVTGELLDALSYQVPSSFASPDGYSFSKAKFARERHKAFQNAVSRLIAGKIIVSRDYGPSRSFLLTETGLDLLFAKFPKLKYGGRRWDGFWRVVIYDIPEKASVLRNRLRTELRRLGYKHLQKSVWLTPLPVEEELKKFLIKEGLWGRILVLKTTMPPAENKRFADLFRKTIPTAVSSERSISNQVSRFIKDPLLPQGL